jgi:hexosaminidase
MGIVIALAAATLGACTRATITGPVTGPRATPRMDISQTLIPAPLSAQSTAGESFTVDSATVVVIAADASPDVERIGRELATMLGPGATRQPRRLTAGEAAPANSISLAIAAPNASLGDEGYELTTTRDRVTLTAPQAAGLFYGVQTIRLLLPASIEHRAALDRVLMMPAGHITDAPRFAWRGAMLDVSRHFLPPEDVKRFIDFIAIYKLNRLHLHLADDQGWRIEIKSRPNLAAHGGSTEVGGGVGGYYTQTQFADIVAYAQSRFVTIVPEIDMPGHSNAALSSYPELNCDGQAPPLYDGIHVGFSTLCVDKEPVYAFIEDVVREIAALVPTPYFHIGGDEVQKLTTEQYRRFVERVQGIVQSHGKRMIGWGEIAPANLTPQTIVQHWKPDSAHLHAARGGKVILSPNKQLYLDMKYDSSTVLGLHWAGYVEVRNSYDWDPPSLLPGVAESAIFGVEAPLWSETLEKLEDFEFMAFPRLIAAAEVGWSPAAARQWDSFRLRLGMQGPRLQALGVNFYRSPQVPWSP